MSSSDQAKSKLLNSMRMSKQGVADTVPAVDTAAAENNAPAKKAQQTTSKPAASAKQSKPAAKSTAAKSSVVKKPVVDNFQAAQRVWPD